MCTDHIAEAHGFIVHLVHEKAHEAMFLEIL